MMEQPRGLQRVSGSTSGQNEQVERMHSMQNDQFVVPIEQKKSEDAPAIDGNHVGLGAIDDILSGTAVNPNITLSIESEPSAL
jgi:hypothetical protein